ncbi:hypothetical protein FNF28_07291 [Cafeteria roenbergensis]|uniref:phosphoserine phosphatase n=1 Tax=Cafeteria roenbergensis TaxID=33653 RepID=A0A5A8CDI1_CAFRO|nr:hypothetical protein FNF28_07291 [Cafeteria roenbergensis]
MSAASEAAVEPCSKSDMTREEAKLAFQEADAVCFDVDSTVVTTEGVDEFAAFLGVGDKVAELTASAMNGDMKGTHVYLVSGGFTQMIFPLADRLSLPRSRVFANTILFGDEGEYSGFDQTAPTAWAGGKAKVIAQLRQEHGYPVVAMAILDEAAAATEAAEDTSSSARS